MSKIKLWLYLLANVYRLLNYILKLCVAIYLVTVGVEAVTVLSKWVMEVSIQTQLKVNKETWPLAQPKIFAPRMFIQHKACFNIKKVNTMAEKSHINKVVKSNVPVLDTPDLDNQEPLQEMLETDKITKEIEKILEPLESSNDTQFVLIEGAPGIGKSLLLKEMAYRWSKKTILQKFTLVLLICLRDPAVQQEMPLFSDLLKLFCKRDNRVSEISSECSKYFLENHGKGLALLLDGYDEYPETLQSEGLIADILQRKILPSCTLILSSRPHASRNFHCEATVRVNILGFTEAEQKHYIKESLKGKPHKIDEFTKYLQFHSTIKSLCFEPFNIIILVYLYEQGISLPKNSAELCEYFICLTVCQYLAKHRYHIQSDTIKLPKLTDLPEPCSKIVQQLSKLSLEALNDNKWIFTLNEIKAACPDITTVRETINSFGLLQAVEHPGLIGTTTTFNFLHFSIQEYLAAYYIANLPADKELKIIENTFCSNVHHHMISLYIVLTKGQRPAFKHHLCQGNKSVTVYKTFLYDHIQSICLYYYFHEAGDLALCKIIDKSVAYRKREIDLSLHTLTPEILHCVVGFLTLSRNKIWEWIKLSDCFMQDHGLHILHNGLPHDITINTLWLQNNWLSPQSSSLVSDITIKCKVKELWVSENYTIGENEQLYSMLSNSSTVLEKLFINLINLSSRGAIHLFKALKDNNTLKELVIAHNFITDDASDAIVTALEKNSCLVKLHMGTNALTGEAMVKIVKSLKVNKMLTELVLTNCHWDRKKEISCLQEVINKERASQGSQAKLEIYYSHDVNC